MRFAPIALVLVAGTAIAAESPPPLWRDMPMYPGFYAATGYERDARDSSFDSDGNQVESAMPLIGGKSSFKESRGELTFSWYFPLFETYGIPFVSDHLFTSRMSFGYQSTYATGDIESFIRTNPDKRPATNAGTSGIQDVQLEFGTFLLGGRNWRAQMTSDYAVLLLVGLELPVGTYERQAPTTPGRNTFAWHTRLGMICQLWPGGFLDAGAAYRRHSADQEPQFGGSAPTQQGNDRLLDLSFVQRLVRDLYIGVFAANRRGSENTYNSPAYLPNAPDAPAAPPQGTSRVFPTPGVYRDNGTSLLSAGLSIEYFLTQNWRAGIHYTRPLSGRSGQFDAAFTEEQCAPGGSGGGATCSQQAGETRRQDGLGGARIFASDSVMATLTYKFDDGDLFPCIGCAP